MKSIISTLLLSVVSGQLDDDCYRDAYYNGNISHALVNGTRLECLPWDRYPIYTEPYKGAFGFGDNNQFIQKLKNGNMPACSQIKVESGHNYCRSPDNDIRPWCLVDPNTNPNKKPMEYRESSKMSLSFYRVSMI